MVGTLHIGAVPLAVMLLVPETLRTFGREFPDIQLRVLRPKDAAAAPLPVIYHIHGGGFVAGTADQGDMSNGPLKASMFISRMPNKANPRSTSKLAMRSLAATGWKAEVDNDDILQQQVRD